MQPKVVIDNLVYRRIMHWINKSDHEVSGLGIVQVEADGILRVTHAMLLPQVNGPTHTDIEPEDAAKLLYKCKDIDGALRFWWHSHVNMDVFWSGTDMDTIKKIGQGGWFLSTVFNKKREMRSSFYSVNGTRTPWGESSLFQDNLTTTVMPFHELNAEQWDAEYTENVKERITNPYFHAHHWAPNVGLGTHDRGLSRGPSRIRPHGMSKKEWKALRKASKTASTETSWEEFKAISALTVVPMSKPIAPSEWTQDAYGFTSVDWQVFGQEGWTNKDVDTLFELDVSPAEMLALAKLELSVGEIEVLLIQGWDASDILEQANELGMDKPVFDNSPGSKYDA